MTRSSTISPAVRGALLLLLIFSGAAGLSYQVLWVRQLSFVLGGSALALSTIVATFFAGLGLGGYLGGKVADRVQRPLVAYAVAEVGIAVTALATPFLLDASGSFYLGLYRAFGDDPTSVLLARVLATAAILLVPTTLMGATLPFVTRFYIRSLDRLGRGLGLLYGLNTLGGVLGCAFIGYYAILTFGVRHSFYLAVGANLVAALGAFVLHLWTARRDAGRGLEMGAGTPSAMAAPDPSRSADPVAASPRSADSALAVGESPVATSAWVRTAYIGFFLSGFTSIAYEVLWTRALNFAIGNSVYAYTTILAVFLAGLVPGALVAGRLADRARDPMRTLGWIQVLTAAAVLGLFSQAHRLPGLTTALVGQFGAGTLFADVVTKVLPAAVALFVPAVIIGLTFPFVLRIVGRRLSHLGRSVGDAYAVNTIGGILGSVLAGFVLLPTIGTARGMVLVAAVNLLLAALFFRRASQGGRPGLGLSLAGVVALGVLLVVIDPVPFIQHTAIWRDGNRKMVWSTEGHTASVSVSDAFHDDGRRKSRDLFINLLGASVVDDESFHQQYYASVSLIPIALHASPKRVFVAGLASGVTTGAAGLDERVEKVTCVEISPEVVEAARLHFDELNYGAHSNPRIEILADDARAYLVTTSERYDVLVTDVFLSAVTGTTALYSRDYFELCRTRLAPGGVMSVGVGTLQDTDRTVARTFCESFPHVAVLVHPKTSVYNRVFLLGSNEPFSFRWSDLRAAYGTKLGEELARYEIPTAEALASTYLSDGATLLAQIQDVPVCTDDRPVIDFHAVAWAEGFVSGANERKTGPGVIMIARRLGGTRTMPFLE